MLDKTKCVRDYIKKNNKELNEKQIVEAVWLMNEGNCTTPQNTEKEIKRVVKKVFYMACIEGT